MTTQYGSDGAQPSNTVRSGKAAGSHRHAGAKRALSVTVRRSVTRGKALWRRLAARPGVAHVLRMLRRYSDRQGSQFAAAITYFSFLSLIPILMVSFSVAGFVFSSRPDLLDSLKDEIITLVPGDLGDKIGDQIDVAVRQRLTVGIIGLVTALYSGLKWIGNVRKAVRAQWRPRWDRGREVRPNFVWGLLLDLISLAGLAIAVLASFALTAIGTAAQGLVVNFLGIGDIGWLSPVLHVGPFAFAIVADVLIFAWVYTILPWKGFRADRRSLLIGSLSMAICFEVLKSALTILVSRMSSSSSGAVFGTVIGLLLFFNLVAQAFLINASWIATRRKDEPALIDDDTPLQGNSDEDGGAPPVPVAVVLRDPRAGRRTRVAVATAASAAWLIGRRRRRRR